MPHRRGTGVPPPLRQWMELGHRTPHLLSLPPETVRTLSHCCTPRWSSTNGAMLPWHAFVGGLVRCGLCLGKLPQERLHLRGPPPSHFANESQLGIRSLFSSSGDGENCSILPGTTWTWQTVVSHWGHQSGVNGQLCSVKTAIRQQPPRIGGCPDDPEAPNPSPGSCLPANSGRG